MYPVVRWYGSHFWIWQHKQIGRPSYSCYNICRSFSITNYGLWMNHVMYKFMKISYQDQVVHFSDATVFGVELFWNIDPVHIWKIKCIISCFPFWCTCFCFLFLGEAPYRPSFNIYWFPNSFASFLKFDLCILWSTPSSVYDYSIDITMSALHILINKYI